MHRPSPRRLIVSAALTLTVLAPVAACNAEPVSPLPAEGPRTSTPIPAPTPLVSPSASATTLVTSRRAIPRHPPTAPSPAAPSTPACLGAVVHTLTADTELALVPSLCFAVGGVLRVEGTGPGTVSADPQEKVSQFYEAGVVECRFLSPGTVTVSIERDGQTHTIPVVVR